MSRFLLLNFEDFGLNQDITKTIQSHTPFCVCCLQTNVPLINLANCNHSSFLDIYFKPELKPQSHVACHQCHAMLIKIKQFKQQVENSLQQLQNVSFNIVEQKGKTRLNIHKTVDILLSPTNVNETVLLNEIKSESALERAATPSNEDTDVKSTKKLKNIQKALEIINNNRSDDNLAILDLGLQCLTASDLGDIGKPLDVSKKPKVSEQSSQQSRIEIEKISIKTEQVEFDHLDDNESESTIVKTEESTEEAVVTEEYRDKVPQGRLYIKTVTLSKEELMKERYLKTQSIDYLKHQYKCDHCIIGFNYKDNLDDHIQRKHTPKLDSVTCDLCLQVLHPIGSFYAHNFSHYTRYECVGCKKRFHEYGDALKHYRKQHGFRKIASKCRFCDFSIDSKSKLKVHIQKYHNKFPCEVCGVSLASLTSRKWHKMVKHEKKCTQCSLHFTTSNEFCKHMQRYHAYCAECDVRFKSWYACISHMRFSVVHADKRKRTAYNHTMAGRPDEPMDLTDLLLPSMSNILTEAQDAAAFTSATPFAEPPTIAAPKSKAQKQREYRQRIAASRTSAQAIAARKSDAERQRNCRLRKAANLALISGSLEWTTASSSRSGASSNDVQTCQVSEKRYNAEVNFTR